MTDETNNPRFYRQAFNGGMLSADFQGRVEDVYYQNGLAELINWEVLPHGPIERRPGFEFVATLKTPSRKSRLIPFDFGSFQTMVIEIGHLYFRFYVNGAIVLDAFAQPLEVEHPYIEADLFELVYSQDRDVITITHPKYPPAELRRLGATNWQFQYIEFNPVIQPPANVTGEAIVGTPAAPAIEHAYAVTAVDTSRGIESEPATGTGSGGGIGGSELFLVTKANPAVLHSIDPITIYNPGQRVFVSGVNGMTQINGEWEIHSFTPTEVFDPFFGTLRVGFTVTLMPVGGGPPVDSSSFSNYVSGGVLSPRGATTLTNNLAGAGAKNIIRWNTVQGADLYRVYKFRNGVFGYIGETREAEFTDDNIAPNTGVTPPIRVPTFVGPNNYPWANTRFEQRRFFAGTNNEPDTVKATRTGTEVDFSFSAPTRDDDRLDFRIASSKRQQVMHLIPLSDLIALTNNGEWRISPPGDSGLTPFNLSARLQSEVGSSFVSPVVVNNNLLFVSSRGSRLHRFVYDINFNGYKSIDLTVRITSFIERARIVDMAVKQAPYPVIYCVLSDGRMLCMTYLPEQEVNAWYMITTPRGIIESVCVITENGEDRVYICVRRNLEEGIFRNIERMSVRWRPQDEMRFNYLDCAYVYSGPSITEVTNLFLLNLMTVDVIADGVLYKGVKVSGNKITLDKPANYVSVGLSYSSIAKTLPVATRGDGAGQGRPKSVVRAWLRVLYTRGLFAGQTLDALERVQLRQFEPLSSPVAFLDGEVEVYLPGGWGDDGSFYIVQNEPFPSVIQSLTMEVAVAG